MPDVSAARRVRAITERRVSYRKVTVAQPPILGHALAPYRGHCRGILRVYGLVVFAEACYRPAVPHHGPPDVGVPTHSERTILSLSGPHLSIQSLSGVAANAMPAPERERTSHERV